MNVTFIIPILWFKPLLQDTLAAIPKLAGLETGNYEILVVQNGPKQPLPNWITSLSKVTVIHEPQKSIPKARNIGLAAAKFEFIAYLDEDSICPSDWLTEAAGFLQCRNVAAFQSPSFYNGEIIRHEEFYLKLRQYHGIVLFDTGASFFRKSALTEIGGFDETFVRVEDYEIAMRLAHNGWMLSYGTIVVGGGDKPFVLKGLHAKFVALIHLKRIYQKYDIPFNLKIFPSDFNFFAKKSKADSRLKSLLFFFIRIPAESPFAQKNRLKFMTLFLDQAGKSSLIKTHFTVLLTKDAVILLIGRRVMLSTQDNYVHQVFSQSDKVISVELEKINDENFVKELAPLLMTS